MFVGELHAQLISEVIAVALQQVIPVPLERLPQSVNQQLHFLLRQRRLAYDYTLSKEHRARCIAGIRRKNATGVVLVT
jgi:hypothetical protein